MAEQLGSPVEENRPYAYTPEEVAEIVQLPKSTIQEMCRQGEIPARKVGRYWRIPRRLFDGWLHTVERDSAQLRE